MSSVSRAEKVLLVLVVLTVIADVILSLCVFFVVPRYLNRGYISRRTNITLLVHDCRCFLHEGPGMSGGNDKPAGGKFKGDKKKNSRFSQSKIRAFPYVVSLSIPAYIDEPSEMAFACNGVIVSRNWVLAGGVCIVEEDEWMYLKVRELSDLWSEGGIVHKVVSASIQSKTQPLVVKVKEDFVVSSILTPILPKSINSLLSVGWRPPKMTRRKHEPFLVDMWTERSCWGCRSAVVQNFSCKSLTSGKPLIANCNYLYGMRCEGDDQFLLIPERRADDWWVVLQPSAEELTKKLSVFGLVDLNIETCIRYDFAKPNDLDSKRNDNIQFLETATHEEDVEIINTSTRYLDFTTKYVEPTTVTLFPSLSLQNSSIVL